MSNAKLTVLGAIAAVLVVWSIILGSATPGSTIAFVKGRVEASSRCQYL